jgi:MFS superfamily sulfate permease-like transporter
LYKIGRDQLLIFVITLVGVLATDLLIGIAIGVVAKLALHIRNGLPWSSVLRPYLEISEQGERHVVISAQKSAVFSNFIPFRRQIEQIGLEGKNNITIDLSQTQLVDHTVMEQLHELESLFERQGLTLRVIGLDAHRPFSDHPRSARKQTTKP